MTFDFDGSGLSEILVSGPAGIAVLGVANGAFTARYTAGSGTPLGSWRVDPSNNHFGPVGDFDGDGIQETFVRSPWGIAILKLVPGSGMTSTAIAANGTHLPVHNFFGFTFLDGWVTTTSQDFYGMVGDFDHDGKDEIFMQGMQGIAILKQDGGGFSVPMMANDAVNPDGGSRVTFGAWNFSIDDTFALPAYYEGPVGLEILVMNSKQLGILKNLTTSPTTVLVASSGQDLGGWTLNMEKDQFGPVGAFVHSWAPAFWVSNADGIALLQVQNGALKVLGSAQTGSSIDGWRLGGDNRLGPVGDFDGDGLEEVLIISGWGIGILKYDGTSLRATAAFENGTVFGGWTLDTSNNRLNVAGRYTTTGHSQLFVSSPWGIGLLDFAGTPAQGIAVTGNGSNLGSWTSQTDIDEYENGVGRAHGLLIYHSDWGQAINDTGAALNARGATFQTVSAAAHVAPALQAISATSAPGDKLFVYLGVHGDGDRPVANTDRSYCGNHVMWTSDWNPFYLRDIAPYFTAIAKRNVDLIVFDGSCHGGETVLNAMGERYCATATTCVTDVSLTDTPDPGPMISTQEKPATFSTWWRSARSLGSTFNGAIIQETIPAGRVQQRLFANDNTQTTNLALFGRSSISILNYCQPYFLDTQHCVLFKTIWPDDFNKRSPAEQALYTNSAQWFINYVQQIVSPTQGLLQAYNQGVLVAAAGPAASACAAIYAANFTAIWRTLATDPAWDPVGSPDSHSGALGGVVPSAYPANGGFASVVSAAQAGVNTLLVCLNSELNLLSQIGSAAQANAAPLIQPHAAAMSQPAAPRPFLPKTREEVRHYEAVTARDTARQRKVRQQVNPPNVVAIEAMKSAAQPTKPSEAEIKEALDRNVALYLQHPAMAQGNEAVPHALAPNDLSPDDQNTINNLVNTFIATLNEHTAQAGSLSVLLSIVEDVMCANEGSNFPGTWATI